MSLLFTPLVFAAPAVGTGIAARFTVAGTGLARTFDSSDAVADAGVLSRAWDFGDGTTAGNLTSLSHTFAAVGTYTVTLTLTDLLGAVDVFATEVTVGLPTTITTTVVETIDRTAASQASIVTVCNLALGHLGISKTIVALTEQSEQARACNRFYAQLRDEVLSAFAWPFATRTELLGLVEEDPTTEWGFSYRMPLGCLVLHRLLSGVGRQETRASRVPYRIQHDDVGALILTDLEDAEAEYTQQIPNAAFYPPAFVKALSLRLAGDIAPQLTGGDPGKLGLRALQRYEQAILQAKVIAGNEDQPDVEVESDAISARY